MRENETIVAVFGDDRGTLETDNRSVISEPQDDKRGEEGEEDYHTWNVLGLFYRGLAPSPRAG